MFNHFARFYEVVQAVNFSTHPCDLINYLLIIFLIDRNCYWIFLFQNHFKYQGNRQA